MSTSHREPSSDQVLDSWIEATSPVLLNFDSASSVAFVSRSDVCGCSFSMALGTADWPSHRAGGVLCVCCFRTGSYKNKEPVVRLKYPYPWQVPSTQRKPKSRGAHPRSAPAGVVYIQQLRRRLRLRLRTTTFCPLPLPTRARPASILTIQCAQPPALQSPRMHPQLQPEKIPGTGGEDL